MFASSQSESERREIVAGYQKSNSILPESSNVEDDKELTFARGIQHETVNLKNYPKQGLLLQHLRSKFQNNNLSYFCDPNERKEINYQEMWTTNSRVILVLQDADNMNSMIRFYEKDM